MKIKVWMGITCASLVVAGGAILFAGHLNTTADSNSLVVHQSVAAADPYDPIATSQQVAAADPYDPIASSQQLAAADPYDPIATTAKA